MALLVNSLWLPAQPQRIALEVGPSAELGWWVYDKGRDGQHLGYDHTSLAFTGGVETHILVRVSKQWMIGAEYAFRALMDHDMTRSESPFGNQLEYDISSGSSVDISRLGLEAEYLVTERKRFALAPHLKAGLFSIRTIHPEAANFGRKTWWEAGINFRFALAEGIAFQINPQYNAMHIQPKLPRHTGEKHRLYGMGIGLGLRVFIL